jgi:hypothetical protein
MVVGFNHNIMYRGEMFHVQTEDSGINNPHIITLLYRGGTIIASRKTGYADILKIENLEKVVEELMKEQHKDVLRRLKNGEFDGRAFPSASAASAPQAGKPVPSPDPEPAAAATPPPDAPSAVVTEAPPVPPPESTPAPAEAKPAKSLDEIILNYLVAGDD